MSLSSLRFLILSVLFFLSAATSISGVKGFLILMLLALSFSYSVRKMLLNRYVWLLFSLLLVLTLSTIISSSLEIIKFGDDILFRYRYWFLQIALAIGSYLFFKFESISNLKLFIKSILLIFVGLGFFQVIVGDDIFGRRVYLFTHEPSQAGGLMLFFISIYYVIGVKLGFTRRDKQLLVASILIMLLTGSKAVAVTFLLAVALNFITGIRKTKTLFSLVGVLIIALPAIYFSIGDRLEYIVYTITTIANVGITALSYEYQIWDSFIMRFLGWYASFSFLLSYPFGIGTGGFNQLLPTVVNTSSIIVDSRELIGVLSGELYSTPKSYFLEILSSGGILSIVIFTKIITPRLRTQCKTMKLVIIITIFQGFIVELSPYLTFLLVIIALLGRDHEFEVGK